MTGTPLSGLGPDGPDGPRSVHRALMLLTHVVESGPLPLSVLARDMDLPSSTAMRILRVLAHWGYVARDDENRYGVGPRFSRAHSEHSSRSYDLVDLSEPVLGLLTSQTRESSYLSVLSGPGTLVYLRQVHSPESIRHVDWAGRSMPVEGTAAGAALLGDVGERGVAIADAIATEGSTAIAAPVRDARGDIVAALSVVGPSFRLRGDFAERCSEFVLAASRTLTSQVSGTTVGPPL